MILGWCRMVSAEFPGTLRKQIKKGVFILKSGGIVAFPTDTVYGLGASASIPEAVAHVYVVKGRPLSMPMPLLLARVSQIEDVAESVSPLARLLVRKFLPGALTLILPRSRLVSDIVTGGGETVAVRIPAHPVPLALISGLGAPLLGTSANLSGQESAITASEVYTQFGERIDLVIDGGRSPGGRESTIVDVCGRTPVILREGAVPLTELEQVCGDIVFKEASEGA